LRALQDKIAKWFFFAHGIFIIFILFGIFYLLLTKSLPGIQAIGLGNFIFGPEWRPTSFTTPTYGIKALVVSSLMVTFGAMVIAVPLGIGCAAYLAEVAKPKEREILKPIIEILAGIPSVVVGFFGLVVVGPFIAKLFGLPNGLNALNGSILLAIMALPTIITLAEDAITAVPAEYKTASLALGANRWETIVKIILPAALSGIIAAIMLGMGRAIGETMTVLMATGNALAFPTSLLDPVRTMTATIAIELGEVPYNTDHYYALFVVGLVLFAMTFLINLASDIILHKYQEVE
jgi:phosphate transport system permease protein